MERVAAARVRLDEKHDLVIEPERAPLQRIDFNAAPALGSGWDVVRGAFDANSPPQMVVMPSGDARRRPILRLYEFEDYVWTIRSSGGEHAPFRLRSSLERAALWRQRGASGRFRVDNYLGLAWIEVALSGRKPVRLIFEIASRKLDYDTEYRAMLDEVAATCQQLLLHWRAPTELTVAADTGRPTVTSYERFLLLRSVLVDGRLEHAVRHIDRYPHSALRSEAKWERGLSGDPRRVCQRPFESGRDWQRQNGKATPSLIATVRQYETLDTPPNRFARTVLGECIALCDELTASTGLAGGEGREVVALRDELCSMRDRFTSLLNLPLFSGVAELKRVPYENPVLRRRAGYRELLQVWQLIQSATKLKWDALDEAFTGGSRDVATLYEYWLFLGLVQRLGSDRRFEAMAATQLPEGTLPAIVHLDKGRVGVTLKKGFTSVQCFRYRHEGASVRLHVYYNRQYRRSRVGVAGSYSTALRPDISLVLVPDDPEIQGVLPLELAAEREGLCSYLHLDAKYRADRLAASWTADDTSVGDEDERLTAKREDLYKMHTYNDAIRRTVGSYVLFPGTVSDGSEASLRYERYHEIMPGVGAFAVRPMANQHGVTGIEDVISFLCDVAGHFALRVTQHSYISRAAHRAVGRAPVAIKLANGGSEMAHMPAAPVLLARIDPRSEPIFRQGVNGHGPFCVVDLDDALGTGRGLPLELEAGTRFVGYSDDGMGRFCSTSWHATLRKVSVISAEAVKRDFAQAVRSKAALILLLDDLQQFEPRELTPLLSHSSDVSSNSAVAFSTLGELIAQPLYRIA